MRTDRPPSAPNVDLQQLAHLARLTLTEAEQIQIAAQLGDILAYMDKLKEVDVTASEPTAHAVPLVNVTRPDLVQPSLEHTEAVRSAPAHANGLFIVPKILE
jgi:aspartyl-tRNA(Asn)/glutamyl-tRNA(Gln) amidotransferase subunit C